MGVHTIYTDELAQEIIDSLSEGVTLQDICRREHMPSVRTVNSWANSDECPKEVPSNFSANFARAREIGFDAIAAEALRIANTPVVGEEVTVKADGTEEIKRGDMLGHRKLQIETRLKLLAKWDPRRYGERQAIEHSGNVTLGDRLKRAESRLDE